MDNPYEKARERLSGFGDKPFRPGQIQALKFLRDSDKRIKVLCAPAGCGKSLLAMVEGMQHSRFLYLCSSRQLQMQIEHEFPEAKVMWGRSNFRCNKFPDMDASECIYSGEVSDKKAKFECKKRCSYEIQKAEVLAHPIQVLNYAYFITEANYVGKFTGYPLIVCDEADMIEGIISKFINVRISKRLLKLLKIPRPKYVTTKARGWDRAWKDWAGAAGEKARDYLKRLEGRARKVAMSPEQEKFHRDESARLSALVWKLELFMNNMDDTWIFEERKNFRKQVVAWEFKPTWIPPAMMEQFFLRHGYAFILMSATFPPIPVLCRILGIRKSDVDHCEVPSSFPRENRKIILERVGDLSYKTFNEDIGKVKARVQEIMNMYPDDKGVIHTVSWRLNKEIMDLGDPRMITHETDNKDDVLALFKRSKQPLVFVSPSSCRGVDLPGDDCRWAIIAKMPYRSLGDKLVSTRVHQGSIGSYWYASDAAQEIVQAQGRGVRSAEDHCVTYILDNQAVERIINQRGLFPKYWIEACDT